MINTVTGSPGNGKSFMGVHHVFKQYALESDRPIKTNLPIDLKQFSRLHNLTNIEEDKLRDRVTFLKDRWSTAIGERKVLVFPDGEEREYVKGDELEFPEAEIRSETYELQRPEQRERGKNGKVVVPENKYHEIREFWRFGEGGCVFIVDEMTKYASSLELNKRSPELGDYLRYHRHYGHDVWFLTQELKRLDIQIRDNMEMRYVTQRSTSIPMFKTKFFGEFKFWWLFFRLTEIVKDPLAERDFKKGEIGRIWNVRPTPQHYLCYTTDSVDEGLPGMQANTEFKGDDQTAASNNLKNIWRHNKWRFITFAITAVVAVTVVSHYFKFALGEHKAPTRQTAQPARVVSETIEDPLASVESSDLVPGQQLQEEEPEYISIKNPGLTHEEVKEIFEGRGFIVGDSIVVADTHVPLAREIEKHGRTERPHYARFLIVRFRDWEGIDLKTIQKVRLKATNRGTRLDFDLEYEANTVPSDYEILSLLDSVLVAGRPVVIQNGKVLREDQASSAENGRVFTSGKFEEEIGLKFEFVPYQYPSKRVIRGAMILDDTTGDTLDETTKSAMESWVELTPDLRLVGSVTREYTRTDSDTIIPFTGWIPVVRKFRWSNDVEVRELLAVYAQHFPDEPDGAALTPEFSEMTKKLSAGQVMYNDMLPIEYVIRGEQIPEQVLETMDHGETAPVLVPTQ